MASSSVSPYHELWWADALDPAHRRDPDIMGNEAMSVNHSRKKFMLVVPHFFVTFLAVVVV
jgi:hypothetical protein